MSCPITLTGIEKGCKNSTGGLKTMFISSQPLVALGTTAALAGAVEFQMKKQTSNFSTTKNVSETAQTTSYTTTITYQINKQDSIKRNEMMELMKASYLYIVTLDNNGVYHYHPEMSASVVAETGTNFTDGGKYMVTFTNESSSLPEIVNSFIPNVEIITLTKLANGTPIFIDVLDATKLFAVKLSDGTILNSDLGVMDESYLLPEGPITLYKEVGGSLSLVASTPQFGGILTANTVTTLFADGNSFTSVVAPKAIKVSVVNMPLLTSVNIPLCTEFDMSGTTTNLFTTVNTSSVGINASIIKKFTANGVSTLTSVTLPAVAEIVTRNSVITTLNTASPFISKVDYFGGNMSATRINTLLGNLNSHSINNGLVNLTGGTNASYATWPAQAQATCTALEARGWTITRNA